MNKEIIFKRLLFQPIYKHYHGFTDFTMNAFRWEDKVENQPWFIKGPNHRNIMSLISHDGNLKNCLGDEANEKDSFKTIHEVCSNQKLDTDINN